MRGHSRAPGLTGLQHSSTEYYCPWLLTTYSLLLSSKQLPQSIALEQKVSRRGFSFFSTAAQDHAALSSLTGTQLSPPPTSPPPPPFLCGFLYLIYFIYRSSNPKASSDYTASQSRSTQSLPDLSFHEHENVNLQQCNKHQQVLT
ncbi:uncharacterized [Tachysurus ichikawai]